MFKFKSDPCNGVMQQFMIGLDPLADDTQFIDMGHLSGMDGDNIFRFLRFVVTGVNRLMRFLNDPRNFLMSDGTVDLLRQLQAYSAVQLIFADINGINFSTMSHNRISYAMSVMDKLANLKVHVGQVTGSEAQLMISLASRSQQSNLKHLIYKSMQELGYEALYNSLCSMIDACYASLHQNLEDLAPGEKNDRKRLDRIRIQRNMRHGAFLSRNQFEQLFLQSSGMIAPVLGVIPFLLVLGLISDPAGFVGFAPDMS